MAGHTKWSEIKHKVREVAYTEYPTVSRQDFIRFHAGLAQEFANLSQKGVDLYWSLGLPRIVLRRWPVSGTLVASYLPTKADGLAFSYHLPDQGVKGRRLKGQDWDLLREDDRNRRATDVDLRWNRRT